MTHLLVTIKSSVQQALEMFSRQYILPSYVDSETSAARKTMDNALLSEVLPQLNIHLMAVTPMERHFGQYCYINNSGSVLSQVTGSLSQSTP